MTDPVPRATPRGQSRRDVLVRLAGISGGALGALWGACRDQGAVTKHHGKRSEEPATGEIQVFPIEVMASVLGRRMTENAYLVGNRRTKDAVIIDPGAADPRIVEAVTRTGFKVRAILNTHGHPDHVAGNAALAKQLRVPVWGPKADAPLYPLAGLENEPSRWFAPHAPGPLPELGSGLVVTPIPTPGHTAGSSCFRIDRELFTGDTLFRGNIGRTWGSPSERDAYRRQMIAAIHARLLPLGDLRTWPGHGPPSSLGWERENNTHLQPATAPAGPLRHRTAP